MRRLIATAVLGIGFALSARATTFGTDSSDLWSDPVEQGWGVNVVQQNDVLFMTFFLYAPDRTATWYVASDTEFAGTQGNAEIFSGPLYQTDGPWFGGDFDPATVHNRQVGTVTFSLDSVTRATVTYTIDGVTVTRPVTRQTWRIDDFGGAYVGSQLGTYTNGCPAPGYAEEFVTFTITQGASSSFSMTSQSSTSGMSCSYAGNYEQSGRMGSAAGGFSCSNGVAGDFQAFEMQGTPSGVMARLDLQAGSCSWSGSIAGLRRGG